MRKIFSLLAAVLFAGSMMAQVTITPENSSWTSTAGAQTGTVEGVTVAVTNGVTGSTTAEGATMRIYKDATLTISSASNISKIVFNCVANNTTKYGPGCFGAQEGYSYDAKVGTWEGSATSVSFTASSAQVRATSIVVTLAEGGDPVVGNPTYYVAGSMNEWKANANYKLAANPAVDGEFMGEFTFKANDEFKVIMDNGSAEYTWYPAGTDNNWKITEDGDYKVYFRPAGNTEWANGYFDVMMKEKPVIPTYNVAEAIAAGLADNTEINVCGIITKMEFKGKNFAQYGSVNIYVADATGAEGAFEFYNCYSLNADTFKTSTPAYDATSTAWAEFTEVADANGNAIHIGDTVIAFGKYKLYNTTHELNTGCNLIEIKHKAAPVVHTYTVAGAPSTVFGDNWNPALEANDMQQLIGGEGYIWSKDTAEVSVGGLVFKVVEDHSWDNKAYPAENYILELEPAYYNIVITFNPAAQPDSMVKAIATKVGELPVVGVETVYNWAKDAADQVGTTILGGEKVTVDKVKIHENTDDIDGIKFASSYVYADGKWIAIKPAEGGFKAGDEISLSVVFNNSDATKYCMADIYAADQTTRLFRSDSASTLNGRNAGDPIVQTYTLAADQDSLLIGRYGNTGMFITLLKVTRALVPPTPTVNYYVAGSMNGWKADENYMLTPNNESLYEGEFTFAANDEFKVIGFDGTNTSWFPEGMGNNFQITEAGDYKITFNPAGNVEGWYAGYYNVVKKEEPIVPDTIDVTMSSLTAPGSLIWDDEVATEGWWQIMGGNDTCQFSLSNGNQITTAAGTYTVADLDPKYSYITVVKANDTIDVAFVEGSITVAVNEAGVVTIVGALLGNDGNVYNFNLTYVEPKAETTVNVNIAEGKMNDVYADYGLYGVYGTDTTANVFVQLAIWAKDGFQGNFTEKDLDFKYVGSGIVEGLTAPNIYTAAITVTPGNLEGEYSITADLLCYNNTLYKVTMTISAAQGIDAVEAATKAIKSLQNGILTIEKAGKTYNVNGTLIR